MLLVSTTASADDPPAAWRAFRKGSDLVASVPNAAMLDGAWSLANQADTFVVDRSLSAPTISGLTGHFTRRILYGTSWTLMLGFESVAVVLATGGEFDWLEAANFGSTGCCRSTSRPALTPARTGRGLGIGGFSFIQLRPRGSHWWFEAGGGSTEQRVGFDPLRTVGESTWVLTPIAALREVATPRDAPLALRLRGGGGIYGGMHNASMHPSTRGEDVYRSRPWTELYPLEGGIGPGACVELALTFFHRVVLEGDLTVAPFLLNSVDRHVSADVAPLDSARSGLPIWRKLDVGVGYRMDTLAINLVAFAEELSVRPVTRAGSRGGLLRFDIPLRIGK